MPEPLKHYDRLAGKVAIVSGAGSESNGIGTGRAISVLFAREGASVCLVDREPERAEETRRAIEKTNGNAFVCPGDVTCAEDCERIVGTVLERYGFLNVLVNNVGIGVGGGRVEQMDEATWHRVINVNLTSAVLMTKYAVLALTRTRGSIVNIASVAALRAHGGGVAYGASKAGMIAMTRDLAVMYGRQGVRANVIAPGHLFTPLVHDMLNPKARELRRQIAPLGVEGDAWDVASAALFLASDEARFITATCLPVDGGVAAIAALTAYGLIGA